MKLRTTVDIALRALRRNLTRAALTALGIIIGVAAVIAMMEIGRGSSALVQKSIQSMGANTLMVLPGSAASGGISHGAGTVVTLTPEDADAIGRFIPAVRSVAPLVRARAQAVYGNKNWIPQNINGSTPAFLDVRDWSQLAAGEMFTERDVRNASPVCVIGQTLVKELFGGQSPLGRELRVQNVNMRVIGVLGRKGANMMGMDQDDVLIAPWTTIKYRVTGVSTAASQTTSTGSSDIYPTSKVEYYPLPSSAQATDTPAPVRFANVDSILVAAKSKEDLPEATAAITRLLQERHKIRAGEPDDFNIRDMSEISQALTTTTKTMTRLLLAVALISLIVGGVGIMNIMLVSVTERTREIGLRMAVGARPRDILQQFLVEAVVLCVSGGLAGILLGRGIALLLVFFLHWPVQASPAAIIAAFVVSASVGIIFGYYPAWKASRLDPIEALRYE